MKEVLMLRVGIIEFRKLTVTQQITQIDIFAGLTFRRKGKKLNENFFYLKKLRNLKFCGN